MDTEIKIDHVTDIVVNLFEGYIRKENAWDPEAAKDHVRRILRDACSELWEQSAAEVDNELLRTEIEKLKVELAEARTHYGVGPGRSYQY